MNIPLALQNAIFHSHGKCHSTKPNFQNVIAKVGNGGNTTQGGVHGTGSPGAADGTETSGLGNDIFLRAGSSLALNAYASSDQLTLGNGVAFTDDTVFGAGGE